MEKDNLYETPKSEVISIDKFDLFGGWLRFYQVANIISVTLLCLIIIVFSVFSWLNYYEGIDYFETLSVFLDLLPSIIVSIMILRILQIKQAHIPKTIVLYLGYYLGVSLVFYAILYFLFSKQYIDEKPTSLLGDIIYYFIWTSYFKKSKRVNVYYGQNAV